MSTDNLDSSVDNRLAFVHATRMKIVGELTKEGKIPNDLKELGMLRNVLNDLDTTSIAIKRIKSDEKVSNGNVALAMAMLTSIYKNPDLKTANISQNSNKQIAEVHVEGVVINPGELDQLSDGGIENYDAFMSRVKK